MSVEEFDATYYVLETDYDYEECAVVYVCGSLSFLANAQMVYILTRDRALATKCITSALKSLSRRSIDTKPIKMSDQSKCQEFL